jgi:hypothetical protein
MNKETEMIIYERGKSILFVVYCILSQNSSSDEPAIPWGDKGNYRPVKHI